MAYMKFTSKRSMHGKPGCKWHHYFRRLAENFRNKAKVEVGHWRQVLFGVGVGNNLVLGPFLSVSCLCHLCHMQDQPIMDSTLSSPDPK